MFLTTMNKTLTSLSFGERRNEHPPQSDKNNILGEKEKEKEAFDDIFFSSPGEDGAGGV